MPYINLQQASEITGKSIRTIRRLCNSLESKDYITYQDGKLMIDVSYLEKNYPFVSVPKSVTPPKNDTKNGYAMDSQTALPNDNRQNTMVLLHEIEILKLEIKHRDQIAQEKEKRIEVLERSLLMLGEPQQKNLESMPSQEPIEEQVKKKRWWHW